MKDLFYSIGIIGTIILAAWNIVNHWHLSKKTTFINAVTSERTKWIGLLRQNISAFCALALHWALTSSSLSSTKRQEVREESDRLRMMIKLQLNPDEADSRNVMRLVDEIPKYTDPEASNPEKLNTLKDKLEELVKISQKILKEEWDKVKAEAKNGDLNYTPIYRKVLRRFPLGRQFLRWLDEF